jgi:Cupin domain
MPKVSKESATQGGDFGPVVDRSDEVDSYTVNFVSFGQDIDATPLLKGLPDDRCQCPHWGYVIKGRMTMRFDDREEVFEAGDAWYAPPGHVPIQHEPGTEIVQFSPTTDLRETEAVMAKNMQAMQGA